ncbi:MAG: PD40 domain-containing protein [Calditrichaceae bacterium]|nr:PD40 domain-containing protein [Calditrichaceae bacterium]
MERLTFRIKLPVYIIISLFILGCGNNPTDSNDDDGGGDNSTTLTGKFAFVSKDDGDREIYTMNANGTNLLKLTDNTQNDDEPSWSPDGNMIAFHTWGYLVPTEIYVMNSDGSNVIPITHDPEDHGVEEHWPSWSLDGSMILYESYADASSEPNGTTIINANLYFANANGSGDAVRITNQLFYDGDPSWSPDGSKVVFVHAQVDTISGNLYSTGYQIWMMDANGSNWVKLSSVGANNTHPRWSPDGAKIVYHSDEGICVVDTDGNYQNLGVYGGNPSWSPDGTKIVYDSDDKIYVIKADGTAVKTITPPVGARQVVWAE